MPLSPYPVRIGRLVDNQSGAAQPVNAQVAPTILPAPVWGRSLPLTVASLSASLAIRRDRTIVLQ